MGFSCHPVVKIKNGLYIRVLQIPLYLAAQFKSQFDIAIDISPTRGCSLKYAL